MKYGPRNIMNTLQQQQAFIQFRKYSTHHEVCIGWFKYISTSITLQSSAKLRVDNLLKTAHLTATEIDSLTSTNHKSVTGSTYTTSRKHTGDHDENDEWKEIVFPAYDLHMRSISFGNGDTRISTIVFEVRCHPDNVSILKIILSRISSDDKDPSSEETIHFVPYGLIQYSSPECYRHQIIMNNNFPHKVAIIIIFNIDSEIMYFELLSSLKQDPRFKGIERTHSTDSDGKWIIITTKTSKEEAIVIIDSLIAKSSAPNITPIKAQEDLRNTTSTPHESATPQCYKVILN